jgi:ElaA protein
MTHINFVLKPFRDLTVHELYEILRLRQEIFVVEQNCPYQDTDRKDYQSYHLMGFGEDGVLYCYTRLIPEGVSYPGFTSIGRVVNSAQTRGGGWGKILMNESILKTKELFPGYPIKIGAQAYLKRFYESLGFEDMNEPYLEDNIPHLIMVMP